MKTIAQFILSLALSFSAVAGFNPNVRNELSNVFQRVGAAVTQATDLVSQTASDVTANIFAHSSVKADASVKSQGSTSTSVDVANKVGLDSILGNLFGQSNADANASADTQVSGGASGNSLRTNDGLNLGIDLGLGH